MPRLVHLSGPRARSLTRVAALLAWLFSTSTAWGNGRFPRGQQLLVDPHDAQFLVLAATYGLVVTTDGGSNWFHICEAAFGECCPEADPVVALDAEGALLTGFFAGMTRSMDRGCRFDRTLGHAPSQAVPDFTLTADGRVVALFATLSPTGLPAYELQSSTDGGRVWARSGGALPDSLRLAATVDVAPSDPNRIYISGLDEAGRGQLLRSDDGGQSFEHLALDTDSAHGETPYIAAVDPQDADALYVRTDLWRYDPQRGINEAFDGLLYSDDGGVSFVELLRRPGKLLGFARSADGALVLAGYGDPLEGQGRVVDRDALGVFAAAAGSAAFERVFEGSVSCLTWTPTGRVFGCVSESEQGFSLGVADADDMLARGVLELSAVMALSEVRGPLDCQECSKPSLCRDSWLETCRSWGREDCEAPPGTTAHGCSAGAANEAPRAPRESSSCACRTMAPPRPAAWLAALIIGLGSALRRARRPQGRPPGPQLSR